MSVIINTETWRNETARFSVPRSFRESDSENYNKTKIPRYLHLQGFLVVFHSGDLFQVVILTVHFHLQPALATVRRKARRTPEKELYVRRTGALLTSLSLL
jgi:hypothetical protein